MLTTRIKGEGKLTRYLNRRGRSFTATKELILEVAEVTLLSAWQGVSSFQDRYNAGRKITVGLGHGSADILGGGSTPVSNTQQIAIATQGKWDGR